MYLTPEEIEVGRENFHAAAGSALVRREFLTKGIQAGIASKSGLGSYYYGYENSVPSPIRVGIIGTGDEGSVLIGALNPAFLEVRSIADVRPYSVWRAFFGDHSSDTALQARPGLMTIYGWKTEDEARRHVKVYGAYEELIENAKADGIEAVVIALPLHLHAPAAVAAMKAGLHVLTEKLMGHSVHECKEMARVAKQTGLHLATGHQRHYNILYDNAVELIRRGVLGDLHYIRAQWHRGNLPGKDSWQQPMPPEVRSEKRETNQLVKKLAELQKGLATAKDAAIDAWKTRVAQAEAQLADKILAEKNAEGKTLAERLGYRSKQIKDAQGKVLYDCPAAEELIRWRLWDRTGGGLMAELGSHQLDAASIFIAAMHGGAKQYPLSVAAAGNRPLFPPDRDVEDHVFCLFEFPAPGFDPKDPQNEKKKIGVQYASINGNGFGGYGETVLGTDGTLILEREQDAMLYKTSATLEKVKVSEGKKNPVLAADPAGDAESASIGRTAMLPADRGYAEELEHWAWCIRNPAPENKPRCHPKVAMGDAVIALTTNLAARQGARIEFNPEWFDPDNDATPEGVRPDVSRYGA